MTFDHVDRMVIRFRDVLAETERLPAHKLRAYQSKLLTPLLLHAYRSTPFYRERLAPLCRGETVDLTAWRQIPILTRSEAQRNAQALTAQVLPPDAGPVVTGQTSGSTGRPLRYAVNELAYVASLGATDRMLRWWKFDGDKTMATFVARKPDGRPASEASAAKGWRVGFSGLHHMLDPSLSIDAQVDWLLARRPHYLTAHSFMLPELAARVRKRGEALRFERINSTSTVLSDDIRSICSEVFGVNPIDQYGARETGLIAGECPRCGFYHVNAENLLIEILDKEGQPCAPGTSGRVIVTCFYNYAMPLIRYEVGDFAVAAPERVGCPVRLPALRRIMGRYRNAFTLRDGRIIYPLVPVARLQEFLSFDQFQIVQLDYDSIEVRYVPLDRNKQVDEAGFEACVRSLTDPSFSVRALAVDSIPRSESGKFEDYLSLVPPRGS